MVSFGDIWGAAPLPTSVGALGELGAQLRARVATVDGRCPLSEFSLLALETQISSHSMPYGVDDSSPDRLFL